MNYADRRNERILRNVLARIGGEESESVARFLSRYGNIRTKSSYAVHLDLYFRWLKDKGNFRTPDQLILDNLACVFKSDAMDVKTKRRHTDWLGEYVNAYLLEEGRSESKRRAASAAICEFYKKNDSRLFGDFSVASFLRYLDVAARNMRQARSKAG